MKVGDIVWLADSAHNCYMYKLRPMLGCWAYIYTDKVSERFQSNRAYTRISLSSINDPSRSVLILDIKPNVFFAGGGETSYAEGVVVLYDECMIMLNRAMLGPLPFPEAENA
ncbi:MAG: hypothetical protein WC761_01660 [Candidatus Paceibacterota bacterium]|jgi:hypothetical protein